MAKGEPKDPLPADEADAAFERFVEMGTAIFGVPRRAIATKRVNKSARKTPAVVRKKSSGGKR
jgi:hypothetical protein